MARFGALTDDARIAARSVADFAGGLVNPTLRLGVAGLSRSGKTVFITALVHNLVQGGRLPSFAAYAEGRLAGARLEPQPDPAVPRFDYEAHLAALSGPSRRWPDSTRRISELRIVIDYESASFFGRTLGGGRLSLDVVDYPGEWLLDLGLLGQDFTAWSQRTLALSDLPNRAPLARDWRAHLASLDPDGPDDETQARKSAELFTAYLKACRDERVSLSSLPPGRFLMPGDLEGSPALTFAPLGPRTGPRPPRRSLRGLMESRYDAYKDIVIRPFFRDHFARLDRQIVLVDLISALNAGPAALADLGAALEDILKPFRPGANSVLSSLFRPRIDKVLLAATKADHLHHKNHDRLEAILARIARGSIDRAAAAGARIDVIALAAVRATREANATREGKTLSLIAGTPEKGERIGDDAFDGETEAAIFPGDPPDPTDEALAALKGSETGPIEEADIRFVRFRPPRLTPEANGARLALPHIRLDRALQFLIGDRLR